MYSLRYFRPTHVPDSCLSNGLLVPVSTELLSVPPYASIIVEIKVEKLFIVRHEDIWMLADIAPEGTRPGLWSASQNEVRKGHRIDNLKFASS